MVTSVPSACAASTVQALTGFPSISTVQAPQLVVSQPTWVPVKPTVRRMWSTSRVRDSTSLAWPEPLMVMLTSMSAPFGLLGGGGQPPLGVGADHLALPGGAAPDIVSGLGCRGGQLGGLGKQLVRGLLTHQ